MPEQTGAQFAWDLLGKPVLIFFMGLLGWNIKRAHSKIDSFPKDYVDKDDYKADTKEIKELMKEDREIFRTGIERIHSRIDVIADKVNEKNN